MFVDVYVYLSFLLIKIAIEWGGQCKKCAGLFERLFRPICGPVVYFLNILYVNYIPGEGKAPVLRMTMLLCELIIIMVDDIGIFIPLFGSVLNVRMYSWKRLTSNDFPLSAQ